MQAGQVLLIPPLFEEMNKSRRFFSLLARRLVGLGYTVTIADLPGSGDSEGQLSALDWQDWLDSLEAVFHHLSAEGEPGRTHLLTCRASSLLICQWLHQRQHSIASLVMVDPCLNGRTYLGQFIRIRVMASRFAGIEESQATILGRIADGEPVEIAGYALNQSFVDGLTALGLTDLLPENVDMARVFRLDTQPDAKIPSPLIKLGEVWASRTNYQCDVVQAEAFWETQEITAPDGAIQHIADFYAQLAAS